MSTTDSAARGRQSGQILPLFALSMVVILAIGALLLDGASMLVTRRHLQNAGDAAALAAANTLQKDGSTRVCTASGSPPGAARADIIAAAQASIATNWPNFPTANISVTCPDGWDNQAVQVALNIKANSYLGGAIGYSAPNVATTSTAVNGQVAGSTYSVLLLDPSTDAQRSSWPNGRKGCPSMQISGGPTIQFDGSVMIDSACPAASGGALAANGGSATVTIASGKSINMVGGYNLGSLSLSQTPNTGVPAVADPLITLQSVGTLTTQAPVRLVLSNQTQVLSPGRYIGGIQLKNSSIALLRPGIYVMDGGGLDIGAQASFCSISEAAAATATNCGNFATDCPDTSCGVLIVNRSVLGVMGQVSVGAGATLKLRAYDDRSISGGGTFEYRNLLLWQEATPPATLASTTAQEVVALQGGGSVDISGTVYAPQAKVQMGGGSGGSGGSTTNVTLQFIAWDLEMYGNSAFHFAYSNTDFARPKDYGLVK
jgi:hypothetical protein